MAIFGKKKEEEKQMSTLEEVKKAFEDLSEEDKKTFVQSLKDRVDESVAAQEEEHGDEDSQTAKDRVDEAEGEAEEEAEERGKEPAEEETEEEAEGETEEEPAEEEDPLKEIAARLKVLEEKIDAMGKQEEKPERAPDEVQGKLEALSRRYGN